MIELKLSKNETIKLTSIDEEFEYISVDPPLCVPWIPEEFSTDTQLNKGQVKFTILFLSIESLFTVYFDMIRMGWNKVRVKDDITKNLTEWAKFDRKNTLKKKFKYPERPIGKFASAFSLKITVNVKDIEKFKSYIYSLSSRFGLKNYWLLNEMKPEIIYL